VLEARARAINFYRLNAIFYLFLLYFVCHLINIIYIKLYNLSLNEFATFLVAAVGFEPTPPKMFGFEFVFGMYSVHCDA